MGWSSAQCVPIAGLNETTAARSLPQDNKARTPGSTDKGYNASTGSFYPTQITLSPYCGRLTWTSNRSV